MIIDQQDDPGDLWEEHIRPFWPDYLPEPDIGLNKTASHHALEDRYPVDTPSNTLASAMYFYAWGKNYGTDEEFEKTASLLRQYMDIHEVEVPDEFYDYADKMASLNEVEEIFADDDENLPITTEEQFIKSAELFNRNQNRWDYEDRIKIAEVLEQAGDYYGVDVELPAYEKGDNLDEMLALRKNAAQVNIPGDRQRRAYLIGLDTIKKEASNYSLNEVIDALDSLDKMAGLDKAWGRIIPDPVESATSMAKKAEYDFSKLEGMIDPDLLEEIKSNPEEVVPTLPLQLKNLVMDCKK